MSQFVRQSKVRHCYADQPKHEHCWENIKISGATGDGNYIKCNPKYIAIPVSRGNGAVTILNVDDHGGRMPVDIPVLDGHKGPVFDFDFNPFHDSIIATGGDDATCKLWGIPEEGLKETEDSPLMDLAGHLKKITCVKFHPTAEHYLATASADNTLKLWDVQNEQEHASVDIGNIIHDVAWSYNGDFAICTARDKNISIIDPRNGAVSASFKGADGAKAQKVSWLRADKQMFCSVGFNRQSKRLLKLWDIRMEKGAVTEKEIKKTDLGTGSGVLMPFFDTDSNLLMLAGKGDGDIKYYELVDEEPWEFYINDFRTSTPARGMCMMPRRGVDTSRNEIIRMYKLTSNQVQPLSFIIPRKSDLFQADLFPDTYAGVPAMTFDEFVGGASKTPTLTTMDPSKKGTGAAVKQKPKASIRVNYAQLEKDLAAANERIAQLEAKLKANRIAF